METMVAVVILSVGLLSLAALMSQTTASTERSRYMSMATILASEKLEDLNHYPSSDPVVAQGGSLTTDSSVGNIDYFDEVLLSSGGGSFTETIRGKDAGGNVQYTTINHTPDGQALTSSSSTAPAIGSDSLVFNRRWLIEADTPVRGVRRITVRVALANGQGAPVTFQTSMVRP
jgi:Tfp pilus assembly protein PilV